MRMYIKTVCTNKKVTEIKLKIMFFLKAKYYQRKYELLNFPHRPASLIKKLGILNSLNNLIKNSVCIYENWSQRLCN